MRNILNEVLRNNISKLKLVLDLAALGSLSLKEVMKHQGVSRKVPLSPDGIDLVGLALCHRMEK